VFFHCVVDRVFISRNFLRYLIFLKNEVTDLFTKL